MSFNAKPLAKRSALITNTPTWTRVVASRCLLFEFVDFFSRLQRIRSTDSSVDEKDAIVFSMLEELLCIVMHANGVPCYINILIQKPVNSNCFRAEKNL